MYGSFGGATVHGDAAYSAQMCSLQDLPAPDSHQTSPPCALLSPLLPKVKTEKGSLRGIACDITRAVKWVWHLKCRNLGNDASKTLDADEESRVTTAACGLAVKF